MAAALMSEERWEQAVALLSPIADSSSGFSVLWDLGWAHFKLGDYRLAQQYLRRAVSIEPNNPSGYYGLGAVLLTDGLDSDAELALSRALELRDSSLARLSLALALMKQGRFQEAENVHLVGLELQPDSVERLEAYADFLDDAGRQEEAHSVMSRATLLRQIN
jgi:Flp pilus assembly protein TadD